jgi:glycogen debranching enzyme
VRVSVPAGASYEDGRVGCRVDLPPHASWRARIEVTPLVAGQAVRSPSLAEVDARHRRFLAEATRFDVGPEPDLAHVVRETLSQAARDLAALRLDDLDTSPDDWLPAAGLPVFVALFGRDSLTAAWQAALLGPGMSRGALAVIGRHRGRRRDDWRDEQPGRLLHQMDTGLLADLEITPFGRYYGTVTTPVFYPIVVSELWHWTGDRAAVAENLDAARAALAWLDRDGDLDGDGFYEYQSRSSAGLRNLGWKDSSWALVHEDGRPAPLPIATCEEQALAYLAQLRMAELLWEFDSRADALRLHAQALRLRDRFNERLWMEDEGFYAMGLDGDKRLIRSIGSDIGICLSTGIIDADRVPRTVERLFADDLFSGWGIRTLSSRHTAYDPLSYQRGSVWPVEHAAIALGLARYGLHDDVARLARAQFELAALYEHHRLPELFGGHPRDDEHAFPGVYRDANWPQAWSASSVFGLIQALTGLYPYAPLRLLLLDPHLPAWLPELTVRGLRVGDARATIRFRRRPDGETSWETLDVEGRLHVVQQPSPWSLTATVGERLEDALRSLLP